MQLTETGMATSRPRVLGWFRSAAILDGDWGTSIAYVLGIAFTLAGNASFWHLMVMLALTTLVAVNYMTICRLYPNGGGVYNSVHHRSRSLGVIGALLLAADYIITMALSVLDACHYLGIGSPELWAIGIIAVLAAVNWFGPKHSGGLALIISLLTLLTLFIIIVFSAPSAIASAHIEAPKGGFFENWHIFVGIILSISGIEAISNMTGLMKDPTRDSKRAISAVLLKVFVATVFLSLAMHAIPDLHGHTEDMVRFLGEHFIGPWFGWIVAIALGFLLISAGNTALNDLISIQFLMAVDNELPTPLRRLNAHGVPVYPLLITAALPICVLLAVHDVVTLAHLYAIGVVGAILINVTSTGTDRSLRLPSRVRIMMIVSGAVLACIELSIAIDKPEATIFASTILLVGLSARYIATNRFGKKSTGIVHAEEHVGEEGISRKELETQSRRRRETERVFVVAVRGGNDAALKFAIDEAKRWNAFLFVLRVKKISVGMLPTELTDSLSKTDKKIVEVCTRFESVSQFLPIVSYDVGYTLVEQAALLGADRLILGSTKRSLLEKVLKGSVIQTVSSLLPEEITLEIIG